MSNHNTSLTFRKKDAHPRFISCYQFVIEMVEVTPGRGWVLAIMAYKGRLHPEGVLF